MSRELAVKTLHDVGDVKAGIVMTLGDDDTALALARDLVSSPKHGLDWQVIERDVSDWRGFSG